jgi:hypothetical protein
MDTHGRPVEEPARRDALPPRPALYDRREPDVVEEEKRARLPNMPRLQQGRPRGCQGGAMLIPNPLTLAWGSASYTTLRSRVMDAIQ